MCMDIHILVQISTQPVSGTILSVMATLELYVMESCHTGHVWILLTPRLVTLIQVYQYKSEANFSRQFTTKLKS